MMPILIIFVTLFLASVSQAATFYVDNTCANNGNGTASTCAASAGAAGPWNTIKNALQVADCAGMTTGEGMTTRLGSQQRGWVANAAIGRTAKD